MPLAVETLCSSAVVSLASSSDRHGVKAVDPGLLVAGEGSSVLLCSCRDVSASVNAAATATTASIVATHMFGVAKGYPEMMLSLVRADDRKPPTKGPNTEPMFANNGSSVNALTRYL